MAENKLNEIYEALLLTAGLEIDDEKRVSFLGKAGAHKPLIVNGKRVVLPTRFHLSNETDSTVRFHPLSENILNGESDVMVKYRTSLMLRLNSLAWFVFVELVRIAGSETDMNHMSPEQSEFLACLKKVDDRLIRDVKALREHAINKQIMTKSLVKVFVKRDAKLDGRNYFRAGIASFPLYEELLDSEKYEKPFGVTLRAGDRKQLIALMETIFSQLKDNRDFYCRGSNSKVAPTIDALMKTFSALAGSLNNVCKLFSGHIHDEILTDGWVEAFENLDEFERHVRLVPPQPGNEGNADMTEKSGGVSVDSLFQRKAEQKQDDNPHRTTAPQMAALTPQAEEKHVSPLQQLMATRNVGTVRNPPPVQQQQQNSMFAGGIQLADPYHIGSNQQMQQQQQQRPVAPWMTGRDNNMMSGYNQPVSNGLVGFQQNGPTNNLGMASGYGLNNAMGNNNGYGMNNGYNNNGMGNNGYNNGYNGPGLNGLP